MAALNNVQLSFFYDRPFQTFGHNSNWLCPRIEKKRERLLYHCSKICKGHQVVLGGWWIHFRLIFHIIFTSRVPEDSKSFEFKASQRFG